MPAVKFLLDLLLNFHELFLSVMKIWHFTLSVYCRFFGDLPGLYYSTSVSSFVSDYATVLQFLHLFQTMLQYFSFFICFRLCYSTSVSSFVL